MFLTQCSIVGFQNVPNFFPNTMLSSYLWALLSVHFVKPRENKKILQYSIISTQQVESGPHTPYCLAKRDPIPKPTCNPPPPINPQKSNPGQATDGNKNFLHFYFHFSFYYVLLRIKWPFVEIKDNFVLRPGFFIAQWVLQGLNFQYLWNQKWILNHRNLIWPQYIAFCYLDRLLTH